MKRVLLVAIVALVVAILPARSAHAGLPGTLGGPIPPAYYPPDATISYSQSSGGWSQDASDALYNYDLVEREYSSSSGAMTAYTSWFGAAAGSSYGQVCGMPVKVVRDRWTTMLRAGGAFVTHEVEAEAQGPLMSPPLERNLAVTLVNQVRYALGMKPCSG